MAARLPRLPRASACSLVAAVFCCFCLERVWLPRASAWSLVAAVNVKNNDEQCFKWAVLSAAFPATKDAQRVSKYQSHEQDLDWTGLTFPVTLHDIEKFERRNEISINIYGWEERCSCYLLRKSDLIENKQHIDLLLLQQDGKSHYSWIKNFSRFARQPRKLVG
eukprot:COSAG05_NODE_5712_length_1110_cov_0.680514_2_plen_164_part_00